MRLVELALLQHLHVEHVDVQKVEFVAALMIEELVHVRSHEGESVEVMQSGAEEQEAVELQCEVVLSRRHVSLDELQHVVVKVGDGRVEAVASDRRAAAMKRGL